MGIWACLGNQIQQNWRGGQQSHLKVPNADADSFLVDEKIFKFKGHGEVLGRCQKDEHLARM